MHTIRVHALLVQAIVSNVTLLVNVWIEDVRMVSEEAMMVLLALLAVLTVPSVTPLQPEQNVILMDVEMDLHMFQHLKLVEHVKHLFVINVQRLENV